MATELSTGSSTVHTPLYDSAHMEIFVFLVIMQEIIRYNK